MSEKSNNQKCAEIMGVVWHEKKVASGELGDFCSGVRFKCSCGMDIDPHLCKNPDYENNIAEAFELVTFIKRHLFSKRSRFVKMLREQMAVIGGTIAAECWILFLEPEKIVAAFLASFGPNEHPEAVTLLCLVDNPDTMNREAWCNGNLVASVASIVLTNPFFEGHEAFDLRLNVGDWQVGKLHYGDLDAMGDKRCST